MVLMALSAAAMGSVMLVGGERLPAWSFHTLRLGGTLIVTGLIHFSEAQTSAYAFLYLWVALLRAELLYPHPGGPAHPLIALAYAAVLATDLAAGTHREWAP